MSRVRTATAEQRGAIYDALVRRNRLVGVLRIGLPALGAIIFGGLLLQLYLGSLVPDFGFANISVDRNNLLVEAPSYSGVGSDGTVYKVEAGAASAALGNTDLIHMHGARFTMTRPDGSDFLAEADTARLQLSSQLITVEGNTRITGDLGVAGTIADARIDIDAQSLVSEGAAALVFRNGATLDAETMSYDGRTEQWQFNRVTLEFPSTPGEETYMLRPGNDVAPEGEAP